VSAVPAALLLAGLAAAALLAGNTLSVAVIAAALLAVCLRAPRARRWPYLAGTLGSALGLFVLWPLLQQSTTPPFWSGPTLPVLGTLDVSTAEVRGAAFQALRLAAVGLAFAAYALLLDHDRLVGAVAFARRSTLAVALATRLVPTLERDAAGLVEALRGRGVAVEGVHARARLVSPLVAGSLERASSLAEAMEARGFGGADRTRAPSPPWTRVDRLAVAGAALAVVAGALWL
jgi:energy-coupling factor transporter transmembrane protein EcfT